MSGYELYRGQAECGSRYTTAQYPSLREAMAAAGLPDPAAWQTDTYSPDEVFTDMAPCWSILAPGAAQEAVALGAEGAS
jgi:hypothetical protein